MHLDDFQTAIHAAQSTEPNNIYLEFLSNTQKIDNESSNKVLDQNTQINNQGADNFISYQLLTNDCMLRYRYINRQLFTDDFFAKTKGRFIRENNCAQIFLSNKGFVAIYLMRSTGDFQYDLQMFCKDIGVTISLVFETSGDQTSKQVRNFCHQVGTTPKLFGESTQWENRSELYIRILKESISIYIRSINCLMIIGDYCADR